MVQRKTLQNWITFVNPFQLPKLTCRLALHHIFYFTCAVYVHRYFSPTLKIFSRFSILKHFPKTKWPTDLCHMIGYNIFKYTKGYQDRRKKTFSLLTYMSIKHFSLLCHAIKKRKITHSIQYKIVYIYRKKLLYHSTAMNINKYLIYNRYMELSVEWQQCISWRRLNSEFEII